jgi:hypothetical protein
MSALHKQSTKAMETTRAATTRTVKARAKARSRMCNCMDCCCCCCPLWDSLTLRKLYATINLGMVTMLTARAIKRVRTTRAMGTAMRVTKAAATLANGDKDSM